MSHPTQPLTPAEAATAFFAGTALAYLSDPTTPFALGRYFNEPVIVSEVPFFPPDQQAARVYFASHPVIVAGTYRPPAPGVAVRALIRVQGAGWSVKGTNMAVALQFGQSVGLTISFLDANGLPATEPGPVTWTSSDPTTVTITPNATDDTQATAVSVKEGSLSTISAVSGSITATIDISVGAGPAVSGTITAGVPFSTPAAVAQAAARPAGT
jgi:hypothetical protein